MLFVVQTVRHQKRVLAPNQVFWINSYLEFNNDTSEHFCKFTNRMHVCFIPLVAKSVGVVRYG